MELFMCVNYPLYNPAIGISKKIKSQIENFQRLGYNVTYTAYTGDGIVICRNDECILKKRNPKIVPVRVGLLLRRFILMDTVYRFMRETENHYDVGFIRWGAIDSSFIRCVQTMDYYCAKIIMDCHGYHKNFKGHSLKGKYTERTTNSKGKLLCRYIDLCLTETKETEIFGIPAIPMDTGIDVEKYTPHCYNGPANEYHLISVANEMQYHGYDRIIRAVADENNRDVFLHLVGKLQNKTERMIRKLNTGGRIIVYGYKTGDELTEIYNQCNIGVGPLAPHRLGGKEGTGIKTKEYFAIGLPYFYAGNELLVPDDYPYVLKLTDDESAIDLNMVKSFYDQIRKITTIENEMRSFASENFSWQKILGAALAELKKQ